MLALAEWIAPDFSIDGFWTYVGATIVDLARERRRRLAPRQMRHRRRSAPDRDELVPGPPVRPRRRGRRLGRRCADDSLPRDTAPRCRTTARDGRVRPGHRLDREASVHPGVADRVPERRPAGRRLRLLRLRRRLDRDRRSLLYATTFLAGLLFLGPESARIGKLNAEGSPEAARGRMRLIFLARLDLVLLFLVSTT